MIKVEEQEESELDQKLRWEAAKRGLEMLMLEKKKQLVQYQHFMGHFGFEACCQCIQRDGFWWPKMRQDIKNEQQKCVKCARFYVVIESFHPFKSITVDQPLGSFRD